MKMKWVIKNEVKIGICTETEPVIQSVADAMAFISSAWEAGDCYCLVVPKECFAASFFDLKTRLLGEVLQKYINYHMKLAIVGSFAEYKSKALQDFIYESNQGHDVFFLSDVEEGIDRLSQK